MSKRINDRKGTDEKSLAVKLADGTIQLLVCVFTTFIAIVAVFLWF